MLRRLPKACPPTSASVLGKLGSDKLFTGAGIRDNSQPANPLNTALKSFSDTGITFLIGDYQEMKVGGITQFSLVADANMWAVKIVTLRHPRALRHGFISIGKDNAAQGILAMEPAIRSSSATRFPG